jgi:integrase
MNKGINRLTEREVVAASKVPNHPDPRHSKLYADGGGLYLKVTAANTRSWVFRYMIGGTAKVIGLGSVDTWSLKEARERAERCRKGKDNGIDPADMLALIRAEERAKVEQVIGKPSTPTFGQVAEDYITAKEKGWSDITEGSKWRSMFKMHAAKLIPMPIDQIDVKAVLQVIEPMWSTRYKLAKKLQYRISCVLASATVRGYREGDNPAAWREHLQHAGLTAPDAVMAIEAMAAMPFADVPAFVDELRGVEHVSALAEEFLILTACRAGEVVQTAGNIGAQWPEIDLQKRTWTIPAGRMKGRVQHRVPLSERAVAILREVEPLRQGNRVFPLGYHGVKKRFEKQRPGVDLHGFRSSFRDWCSVNRIDDDVAEKSIAHYKGSKTEKAYNRDDLLELRRPVMEAWARFCCGGELNHASSTLAETSTARVGPRPR